MKSLRFMLAAAAAVICTVIGYAQDESGMWFTPKKEMITRSGLVEGDAIEFAAAVSPLPAGTYVQFGVNVENAGTKAPLHYKVEFLDGGEWVSDASYAYEDGLSEYSFRTVSSTAHHPSTFMALYKLSHDVSDSLKVRCRVCSPYATDGSLLSAEEEANVVTVKPRNYVGAKLIPLGQAKSFPEKHLLLVGNSFTYYYGEHFMLQEIAFSQGLLLQVNASIKGGQTFRQHCGLEMTQLQCELERGYDYAIIQGQSQEPAQFAAAPDSLADVKKAFGELCAMIHGSNPDCIIYVESTWAYPAINNGGFASLEEFDQKLEEGTTMLAEATGAKRNRVGLAFKIARDKLPEINLLAKDDKHQSLAGSYLKACVSYLTISGKKRFTGSVPSCGLPAETAASLRKIAEEAAAL